MAMRHVRLREYRKRCQHLNNHLSKRRLSKTDKIMLLLSKDRQPVLAEDTNTAVRAKTPKSRTINTEYGIGAHGREKRKGKSIMPTELLDYCPEKFNKLV